MPTSRSAPSTKSRQGCQRCREKHVKCDETKPACRTCVDASAICPGVGRPLRWSLKHEIGHTPPNARIYRPGSGRRKDSHGRPRAPRANETEQPVPLTPDRSERSSQILSIDGYSYLPDFDQTPEDWLDLGLGDYNDLAFQDLALPGHEVVGRMAIPLPAMTAHASLGLNNWSMPWTAAYGSYRDGYASNEPASALRTSQDDRSEDSEHAHEGGRNGQNLNREAEFVQSAALLHTFYRLSSPSKVPGFSDADLVGHFFKHVCRLYSCFDSKLNPFRRLVAEYWSTCPTICLTIQSMALAHLANWYPYMASLGLAKRSQAWRALHQDIQLHRVDRFRSKTALISLLLLGLSSTWHRSSNLSLQYLCIARNLIQRQLQGASITQDADGPDDREFFTTALVHWEMLASFIDPISITPFAGHGMPVLTFPPVQKPVIPHPWTGIAAEFHFALAEIGRILRRQRSASAAIDAAENDDTSIQHADRQWSAMLERFLRTTTVATEEQIADYQDPLTPKADLIQMARAYQHVGLLEIYRIYPDLLLDRSRSVSDAGSSSNDDGGSLQLHVPDDHAGYAKAIDSCAAAIAVHVIDLLESVALSSGACRLQPVLLVAAAGQLRLPECGTSDSAEDLATTECYERIVQYRFNAEERMLALSRKFPQKPLLRMMDIVKEVWHRLDAGSSSSGGGGDNAHWIDVINEKGWQTIMG